MFSYLEQITISLSNYMPLTIFAPLASFIEEAIPPIPSPAIMIITGFLASVQNLSIHSIIFLCILGSIGKTVGAWLIYFIMDKVEDILSTRFGKFIGVTHQDIESFGAHLGKGPRDYIILTVLRALPVIPSTLISVGAGLLKIPLRLFLISTLVGSLIRNSVYLYLGFIGVTVANSFIKNSVNIESIIQTIIITVIVIVLGFMYYKRFRAKK
jgi:membrane protein DedA with SNARE-associated domain